MITEAWTDLPGGFRLPAGVREDLRMEKLIDRALLTLVISLTPGYLSPGGVPRTKTRKARDTEQAELQVLLRLMVNDFGIRVERGYTESALQWRLCELAVERGLLTHHPDEYPVFRTHDEHANWSLWDVMTDERKDRDQPGRRHSTAPRYR